MDKISSGCGTTAGCSEYEVEGGSRADVEVGIMVVGYGVNDRLRFNANLTKDPWVVGARKVRRDRINVCDDSVRGHTGKQGKQGKQRTIVSTRIWALNSHEGITSNAMASAVRRRNTHEIA